MDKKLIYFILVFVFVLSYCSTSNNATPEFSYNYRMTIDSRIYHISEDEHRGGCKVISVEDKKLWVVCYEEDLKTTSYEALVDTFEKIKVYK